MIPKHAQELLYEINSLGYTLKGKEKKFIESVKFSIEKNYRLTPAMSKWLNDIYRKAAGGGRQYRDYV